MNNSEHW